MSKPKNALVLDGNDIKLRLQAERVAHKTHIHIDWLRFTVIRRNHVPDFMPSPALALPNVNAKGFYFTQVDKEGNKKGTRSPFDELPSMERMRLLSYQLEKHKFTNPDADEFDALCQALELAKEVAKELGQGFTVGEEIKPGKDFYKYRWCIQRDGHDCAWVGFLANTNSPSKDAQMASLHVNIEGHACTFADSGWTERFAKLIDFHQAKITRADLALDFFNGLGLEFEELRSHYNDGHFDVRGKRPATKQAGDWFNGAERSLYIGCRKSGKETNIYEKGDQLFGREAKNPWVRIELRYGNKLRILETDILRRPADFFAGASDWHNAQLIKAGAIASVESIPCEKALPLQTVLAEATRNVRWVLTSAKASIATAFKFMTPEQFMECCDWTTAKLPGRLRKFNESDLRKAFSGLTETFSTVELSPAFG